MKQNENMNEFQIQKEIRHLESRVLDLEAELVEWRKKNYYWKTITIFFILIIHIYFGFIIGRLTI